MDDPQQKIVTQIYFHVTSFRQTWNTYGGKLKLKPANPSHQKIKNEKGFKEISGYNCTSHHTEEHHATK